MPSEELTARLEATAKRYAECFSGANSDRPPTHERIVTDIISTVRTFSERACACTTKACAERVLQAFERFDWRADSAPPSKAERALLEELETTVTECVRKASAPPTVDSEGLAMPPSKPIHDADAIVRHTYSGLGKYVVSAIQLDYVRATGELDPKYGKATFVLGIARPPDPAEDPDRPLGAPIVDAAPPPDVSSDQCPIYQWTKGARATIKRACELTTAITRPKCSVVEVWRRAIAGKAPAEGLAKLTFQATPSPAWTFAIDDAPRKVKVRQTIADTCEPTIERPTLP